MTLELCEKNEYTTERGERKPWFVAREGSILQQGAQLLREGYTLGSTALILERRLHSKKKGWRIHYFDSSDLFAYHRDGRVRYVPDGLAGLEMLSGLPVQDGAFVGNDGLYDALIGREWGRDAQIFNRDLRKMEQKEHEVWIAAARMQELLIDYSTQFHKKGEAMGMYLADTPLQTTIRAAGVDGLEDGSQFIGRYHLDNGSRRLVGVAPEALAALARKYPDYASAFVSHASEVKAGLERYFLSEGQRIRQEQAGNVGTVGMGNIANDSTLSIKQGIVATPTYYSFLDSNAPQIPLDIPSEEEVAQIKVEAAARETEAKVWIEKSWNLNLRENDS